MKPMQQIVSILLLTAAGISPGQAEAPQGPELGQMLTAAELAAYDIGVMPDGSGLPAGSGTVEEGEVLYQEKCLACHGELGVGNSADPLAGAIHQLTDDWPEKTIGSYWPYATTLFDFIRRSMPMTQPGSLTDEQCYALVAYLLYLNGLVDEQTVIDADALKNVQMPNRDGFIKIYPH